MTGEKIGISALIDPEIPERRRAFREYVTWAMGMGRSESEALEYADRMLREEDKRFCPNGELGLLIERNEKLTAELHSSDRKKNEAIAERDRLQRELNTLKQSLAATEPPSAQDAG